MKWYIHTVRYIFFTMMVCLFLGNCSDSSTSSGKEDQIPGIYRMAGKKIETRYSEWPIPEGEEPAMDTLGVAFWLKITKEKGRKDTFRFYGLEGADIGAAENLVFPNCSMPDDCKIYAKLTGETLEIDVSNDDRTYQATGSVDTFNRTLLQLEAQYHYQNLTIDYEVEGIREEGG